MASRAERACSGCAIALLVALASAPAPGAPLPASISLEVDGCSQLDAQLLEGLTKLELSSEAETPLVVRYRCEASAVTISIESEAAGTRIVRRVEQGWADDVEPERTVALLAVGLFRAGHALLKPPDPSSPPEAQQRAAQKAAGELASAGATVEPLPPPAPAPAPAWPLQTPPALSPAPALAPAPPPAPALAPSPSPARAPSPAPSPSPADAPAPALRAADRPHAIAVAAGLRAHNVADLLPMTALALRYRYWPLEAVGVGPLFSAELGSTERTGGSVDLRIFSFGASGGFRFLEYGAFQLLGEIEATASVVQLEGDATVSGFESDGVTGATGNLGAGLAPSLGLGGTHVGLLLGVGYLFRAPRGMIDGGDAVQLDGVWISASLAVELGLGVRESARFRQARGWP